MKVLELLETFLGVKAWLAFFGREGMIVQKFGREVVIEEKPDLMAWLQTKLTTTDVSILI